MTLIVSDTSPLNLLIQLGCADILPALFARVLIPPQVAGEMRHAKAPQVVQSFIAAPPPWLEIKAPAGPVVLPSLDRGEAAAISLAIELGAVLMIDELDGRQVALAMGLEIVGAIGVLERAANQGVLQDLSAVHAQIRALRFHISDAILQASLTRHFAFARK